MCGLTGFLNSRCDQTAEQMLAIAGDMAQTVHHRGPDDTGCWCDPSAGIAFGHKRLSIVDLSPCGHQPMASRCGRYVIAYNGEIYNHRQLRKELADQGCAFRGHSDTEVLVEGFAEWGIEATIRRCLGMFAIAVWDARQRELHLIRDRLGKKPLYYGCFQSTVLFGSESKSFRPHPAFESHIDRVQLHLFLRQSYMPHGASIHSGVQQVSPGAIVTMALNSDSDAQPFRKSVTTYWSFDEVARHGVEAPFAGTYEQATEQLEALLTDAVGCRMMADVPLGAFLSGGIDSSLVVALMQKQSANPVKTFTIGFEEQGYNEAPYAKAVATALKTDHTELYVSPQQARDVIPLLPRMYDEPFADSSQIPTFLVSQLARRSVTVSLSGDGGDEVFCGYRRYFPDAESPFGVPLITGLFERAHASTNRGILRQWAATAAIGTCHVGALGLRALSHLPLGAVSRKLRRASQVLDGESADERYIRNATHWPDDEGLVWTDGSANSAIRRGTFFHQTSTWPPFAERQQRWQWLDTLVYLPDDILTKVDRASMSVSLEARTPLLDHRVVEFAWQLPQGYKVQGTAGKRILRDLLAKYVPRNLFERPKVGFGVPIDAWLRGPLRDWAEDLLEERRLQRDGYLNPRPISQKWNEHLRGTADWHYLLWDVLMFQAWLADYGRNPRSRSS